MVIAFVISFFDFRNDVRQIIHELAKNNRVIVFGKKDEEHEIRPLLSDHIEFRLIEDKRNLWNSLWMRIYILFKKLPESKNSYFLMELFKARNAKDHHARKKALRILRWSSCLPKFISYDFFIDRLNHQNVPQINDIQHFIFYTPIASDGLLGYLLEKRKPVTVYVYSWDHPCKHACFSKRVNYLCWSEEMKNDLITLQGISENNIKVTGASQFSYIDLYRKSNKAFDTYPFRYIYFGCAVGIIDLVPAELAVIESVARILEFVRPDWKLLVRPYPHIRDWTVYERLRKNANIVFDDEFKGTDRSVSEPEILRKFHLIEHAEAFFHLGTTMGLEACFSTKPSFIIDFGYSTSKPMSLFNFIHQYQNDKHLIKLAPQNSVPSPEVLTRILEDLENPDYLILNQRVKEQYPIKSFGAFADGLLKMA